jgi:hypothetical protein
MEIIIQGIAGEIKIGSICDGDGDFREIFVYSHKG